jgi:SAM-dependent methyltransferase
VQFPRLEGNCKETTMTVTHKNDESPATLWNSTSGCAWVEMQDLLDRVLQPFEDLLVAEVAASSPKRVLDVGCGTGGTTLAFARLLGAQGRSIGVDISEPMIAAARSRAEQEGSHASFICADAQTHSFERASFDMIVSRFGVMFFEDSVQAFANLRHAASDNAELRFIAWRSPEQNPFMTTAERAAAPLLPNLPVRVPDEPGQFAFADRARVSSILAQSGWSDIELRPVDVACTLPEKTLVQYFTRLGLVGRVLQEADDETRTQVIKTVRAAFDPFVHGTEVRFTAASWLVSARS